MKCGCQVLMKPFLPILYLHLIQFYHLPTCFCLFNSAACCANVSHACFSSGVLEHTFPQSVLSLSLLALFPPYTNNRLLCSCPLDLKEKHFFRVKYPTSQMSVFFFFLGRKKKHTVLLDPSLPPCHLQLSFLMDLDPKLG